MGIFDKIGSSRLRKEQLESLNADLWRIVADGVVSDDELSTINGYFYHSELPAEQVHQAISDVFGQLVYQAISDRRVTDPEFRSLEHIADRLSVPEMAKLWMRQQIQYYRLFSHIESGGALPIASPNGIILQKNEVCHLSVPAKLYEERVVRSTYQGGSRGVSIRIMKGVSYRVGAHRGQIQSERALVLVSSGTFNITNQRLIFSGDRKSSATAFPKLLDLQLYADAIQYSVTNRQKPYVIGFDETDNAELSALIVSRLLN